MSIVVKAQWNEQDRILKTVVEGNLDLNQLMEWEFLVHETSFKIPEWCAFHFIADISKLEFANSDARDYFDDIIPVFLWSFEFLPSDITNDQSKRLVTSKPNRTQEVKTYSLVSSDEEKVFHLQHLHGNVSNGYFHSIKDAEKWTKNHGKRSPYRKAST